MTLASFIKADIQARLKSGQLLPSDLTLKSLAEHYQVSATPVRTAVAELISEGILEKGENLRLRPAEGQCVESDDKESPSVAIPQPAGGSNLLKEVTDDLVRLSLKGKPVFLREEATARCYGVSRAAIRSVFHRLAGTGLLSHIPRRGWRLRPFRRENMHSFLEIRELMELKALDLARRHVTAADIELLLELNQEHQAENGHSRVDESLHEYIVEKSGNPYIQDFFERHWPFYHVLFDWEDLGRDTVETRRQHRQILEAMRARNWDAARSLLSWHIWFEHPILETIAERQGSSATGSDGNRRDAASVPIVSSTSGAGPTDARRRRRTSDEVTGQCNVHKVQGVFPST